jgi:hypothetical protein
MHRIYGKYKNDYICLENEFIREKYREHLKNMYGYADASHDNKIYPVKATTNIPGTSDPSENYSTVYGELTYEGAKFLLNFIESHGIKFFADIGCGCGKIPIMMGSAKTIDVSFGIEIVEKRVNKANEIIEKLKEFLKTLRIQKPAYEKACNFMEKIKIKHGDMFDINYKNMTNGLPSLIFISNLCFSPHITTKLFEKLSNELPENSYIASSKIPSENDMKQFNLIQFNEPEYQINSGSIKLPMTWDSKSTVHFYKIANKGHALQ